MEPKIEPWIKDAVDQIHSETESASCDGYCESRKTALMKIIAQHAPSSPAAPQVLHEVAAALQSLDLESDYYIDGQRHAYVKSRVKKALYSLCKLLDGSPAAPTPHMNAAEFYREVWIKENGGDPRGDWPIRMAEAYAIYRLKVAEAYAAYDGNPIGGSVGLDQGATKRVCNDPDCEQDYPCTIHPPPTPHMNAAEQFEKWIDKGYPNMDYDSAEEIAVKFAEAHAASETARADRAEQKVEEQAQKWDEYVTPLEERIDKAEADLQRKDAAARALISEIEQDFCNLCAKDEGDAHKTWCPIVQLKAALGPISVPTALEVTTPDKDRQEIADILKVPVSQVHKLAISPSPCCANPKMVVKGVCTMEHYLHTKDFCPLSTWRPTHNVCLNCGKEEKI